MDREQNILDTRLAQDVLTLDAKCCPLTCGFSSLCSFQWHAYEGRAGGNVPGCQEGGVAKSPRPVYYPSSPGASLLLCFAFL